MKYYVLVRREHQDEYKRCMRLRMLSAARLRSMLPRVRTMCTVPGSDAPKASQSAAFGAGLAGGVFGGLVGLGGGAVMVPL